MIAIKYRMMPPRFNAMPITLMTLVLLYAGALGFQIHSYHKPIQLRAFWEDASVDTYEPNDPLSWLIYASWLFFASFTLAFRIRAQSLDAFSWRKFCTAGLLLLLGALAAYFAVLIACDSEVGEIDETNASQGLLAFSAIYLASLLAFSGLLPAARSAFRSHLTIARRSAMVSMALVLLLGLAWGFLGSMYSIDCYIGAKFYWIRD